MSAGKSNNTSLRILNQGTEALLLDAHWCGGSLELVGHTLWVLLESVDLVDFANEIAAVLSYDAGVVA